MSAAQNGQRDVVELLLRHRANAEAIEKSGKTSLHWAVIFDHKATVEMLLVGKANVNARDRHGETPLGNAMRNGHDEIAAVLRRLGAKQ